MTMNGPSQSASLPASSTEFAASLEIIRPQMATIAEADFAPLNVDITATCTGILARCPKIMSLREQVSRELPFFDLSHFDTLEVKTEGVIQANFHLLLASSTPSEIPEYDRKLNRYRSLFLADINTLANRGLIDNTKLGELKSPNGYRNLAESVTALTLHLRRNWDLIHSRVGVTAEEIADAEETAARMLMAVANQVAPVAPLQAALERRQAYTLFIRTYEEVRRAVTYLRTPFADVEDYAPTVRSLVKVERSEPVDPAKVTPAAPATAPAPAAPVTFAAPAAAPATGGVITRPGLPNSSPIGEG